MGGRRVCTKLAGHATKGSHAACSRARTVASRRTHASAVVASSEGISQRVTGGPHGLDGACLRDHRTGDVHPIDPQLLDLLTHLQQSVDSARAFEVISGYRSPKTNAMLASNSGGVARKSLHMQGMAIDIRLPGKRLKDLRAAALSLEAGGVGYYPSSDFVHVATGRVRSW